MSTHNIGLFGEIKNINNFVEKSIITGAMHYSSLIYVIISSVAV